MGNIILKADDYPLSLESEVRAGICYEVETLAETTSEASMRKSACRRPRWKNDEQKMRLLVTCSISSGKFRTWPL